MDDWIKADNSIEMEELKSFKNIQNMFCLYFLYFVFVCTSILIFDYSCIEPVCSFQKFMEFSLQCLKYWFWFRGKFQSQGSIKCILNGFHSEIRYQYEYWQIVNKFLAPFFHPVVNYHQIDVHPFQNSVDQIQIVINKLFQHEFAFSKRQHCIRLRIWRIG